MTEIIGGSPYSTRNSRTSTVNSEDLSICTCLKKIMRKICKTLSRIVLKCIQMAWHLEIVVLKKITWKYLHLKNNAYYLKENYISTFLMFAPYFFIYFYCLSKAVIAKGKETWEKNLVRILSMCVQSRKRWSSFNLSSGKWGGLRTVYLSTHFRRFSSLITEIVCLQTSPINL